MQLFSVALHLTTGETTPPIETHSTVSTSTLVIIAVISATPGIASAIYGWWKFKRSARQVRDATATEFGTKLAETAFRNMETQVNRLTDEQHQWEQDKQQLIDKITDLTNQLAVTNQYLQMLLTTLDFHGIERPKPPQGLTA